jgi:hypothetical protein
LFSIEAFPHPKMHYYQPLSNPHLPTSTNPHLHSKVFTRAARYVIITTTHEISKCTLRLKDEKKYPLQIGQEQPEHTTMERSNQQIKNAKKTSLILIFDHSC